MNSQLNDLHTFCLKIAKLDFKQKFLQLAEHFLGVKYGPWQNGSSIEALDDLKYDFSILDCVTYAEVVLALLKVNPEQNLPAFANDFEKYLRNIHYAKGIPSFLHSNHFFCIDWIQNNNFLVQDITKDLWPHTEVAQTEIDRPTWFARHAVNGGNALPEQIQQLLKPQTSIIPYIKTEDLLNNYAQFVDVFPEYCLITIVRPNWDIRERIGTHLNISHLGFAFKDQIQKQIKFYHATIIAHKVVQQTLQEYMQAHIDSPTIRGINVLAIKPEFYNARE